MSVNADTLRARNEQLESQRRKNLADGICRFINKLSEQLELIAAERDAWRASASALLVENTCCRNQLRDMTERYLQAQGSLISAPAPGSADREPAA